MGGGYIICKSPVRLSETYQQLKLHLTKRSKSGSLPACSPNQEMKGIRDHAKGKATSYYRHPFLGNKVVYAWVECITSASLHI
uniref:Uncharacterized protein n=1 Tax=Anguilla anguilla TaxID=7936 RepID=A0A0E9X3J7_ANGAN